MIALELAGGGALGHELKAEVLRQSDLQRFSAARIPTDSERLTVNAQASNRAKFAAENELRRSRHDRAVLYSECACSLGIQRRRRNGALSSFHSAECLVEAFGKDRTQAER